MVKKLPAVGRVEGILLTQNNDPQKSVVNLQYTDRNNDVTEIDIPLLDALYLLNLLEAMSAEHNYDHLRQTPDSAH